MNNDKSNRYDYHKLVNNSDDIVKNDISNNFYNIENLS